MPPFLPRQSAGLTQKSATKPIAFNHEETNRESLLPFEDLTISILVGNTASSPYSTFVSQMHALLSMKQSANEFVRTRHVHRINFPSFVSSIDFCRRVSGSKSRHLTIKNLLRAERSRITYSASLMPGFIISPIIEFYARYSDVQGSFY